MCKEILLAQAIEWITSGRNVTNFIEEIKPGVKYVTLCGWLRKAGYSPRKFRFSAWRRNRPEVIPKIVTSLPKQGRIATEWRTIDVAPSYDISNKGDVRRTVQSTCGPHVLKLDFSGGYCRASLCINGKVRKFLVHRLVAKSFLVGRENFTQVNHIDGNKKNNKVTNLEWVTGSENCRHAVSIGAMASGESSRKSKLTQKQVNRVRELYQTGRFSQPDLAQQFSVSKGCISHIVGGRTYVG